MVVVDDFVAWLVSLLADAGRRRLTDWVLGTQQDRALGEAATAAVLASAAELRPDDDERANFLAAVLNQVFKVSVPRSPQLTLLEELQSGIAAQLVVLDDASLTGTNQSSSDVLGIPSVVLAATLSGHLIQEIESRGVHGGPLEPLSNQLNHDRAHVQHRRIEDMIAQLTSSVRDALGRVDNYSRRHRTEDRNEIGNQPSKVRLYPDGILVEWTSEGPRVSMHDGTTLSPTEMNGLLDRWAEIDLGAVAESHKWKNDPDGSISALIFSVTKACLQLYGYFPEEKELEELSTELARKYDLFWRFMVNVLADVNH
jgi:hypothetical protein